MRISNLLFFLVYCPALSAQIFPTTQYPQGSFRNPLTIPMNLAGNFGELRPNHYHMGLDLKTNARENLPVYAAAEGYIARIKIEPFGFGRAIYINHPNGYTTVYAHLNSFNTSLEQFVKQQQYEKESWKVFLELGPNQFPIKKGDFLAYSGNTGGSQAPHVHFEMRRTNGDVNVNGFLFGFPIPDKVRPRLLRLAVYDRTKSVYEQSPRIFPVKATSAAEYITTPGVIAVSSPKISFGIGAFDTHTGSSNQNGIYEANLLVDGTPVVAFRMDNISYNDTRDLNAHIDYKTKALGGSYLQHLSELPGYVNSIYKKAMGDGVIDLSDEEVHDISIIVKDALGNSTTLKYQVKYNGSAPVPVVNGGAKQFYPLMMDGYETPECEFYIGERCLYDSVHIKYAKSANTNPSVVSAVHAIGASYIPLRDSMLVRIQPTRPLTDAEKTRTVMQWFSGTKKEVLKVDWQGNWASARFRDLGNFQLVVDTEPPAVVFGFVDGADLSKATRITFTVKDNMGDYKNVRAMLDGKWLRFTNDKARTFIYTFDEKCLGGSHELIIHAEDEAGNVTEETYTFTR